MQISFRKAALIAGVAIAATQVFGYGSLVSLLASPIGFTGLSTNSLRLLLEAGADLLISLPLPCLLVILYIADTKLAVPRNLRTLSIVGAAAHGLAIVGPSAFMFVKSLRQTIAYSDVHVFGGQPLASQLCRWLQSGSLSIPMREGFVLLAQIAFLLFLVALSRQVRRPGVPADQRRNIVRIAAIVAMGTTGLSALVEILRELSIYREATAPGSITPFLGQDNSYILLRCAISTLSYLLFAIVPWIVFKSIVLCGASEASSEFKV